MRKHLFFIDDDSSFLYLLERTCQKIDTVSQVSCAAHGRDALDQIDNWLATKQELPDIAFIDINMPVMDGFEFLEHFKQQREEFLQLKEVIPIVMLTSSTNSSDKEKAFATGIVDKYIVKPFDVIEMELMIRDVIA